MTTVYRKPLLTNVLLLYGANSQVEVLVMKALSLGLVKGTLDQIDQVGVVL